MLRTAVWRKLGEFTMGRLLSRIAASHSTGSNRRSSHVYPYFTQLRALMYLFRSVRAPTLQAAASAHPQHGRCPPGLRGRQDVSGFAAPVCRRPRCLQYGRLSPHQPLGGRRRAHNPTRLSSRLGSGSGRASRGTQGYLPQPRRLHWRETQDHPPSGTRRFSSRPQRQHQTHTPLQERLLLSGVHPAHRPVRGHGRSAALSARQILEALRPLLPTGWTVYVQFDSWYASAKLIKYVRRQRWHVTCGLKCNRTLNGVRIDHLASALRHRRYTRVRVTATDGNTTTYYV